MMYRETQKPQYLEEAEKIAAFLLDHPRLPEDGIPYWDFDAADIPDTYRDASAGAIMASALLELNHLTGTERYRKAAEKMIRSLSGEKSKAPIGQNGGLILINSVGHFPGDSAMIGRGSCWEKVCQYVSI